MSQLPPDSPTPSAGDAPSPALVRRRPASVQLRTTDASGATANTANQALGDALRVVYRFLQIGMVVLVGVFLLSGLQSIKEGERGIRVTLGKVTDDNLTPGFQLSLPRPLGEIVKINTGAQPLDLREEFWQNQSGGPEKRWSNDEELSRFGRGKLDPTTEGFLITGDLGIGHATVKVEYVRDPARVRDFARNIHPDDETRIVKAAVMQGMVRAAAGVSIDEFRKDNTVQLRARETAQKTLDDLNSGLTIRSLVLDRRIVPTNLIKVFNDVENSLSNARKAVSEAQQVRTATLTAVAGDAADDLLRLIDRYDAAFTAGKEREADAALAQIGEILSGKPVPSDGVHPGAVCRGEAANILAQAQGDLGRAVTQAQAQANLFAAKLAAYRANPSVVLTGDWVEAFNSFVSRDGVQLFFVPGGTRTLALNINRDPQLQKEWERKRNEEEQARQAKENAEALKREQLKPKQPSLERGV